MIRERHASRLTTRTDPTSLRYERVGRAIGAVFASILVLYRNAVSAGTPRFGWHAQTNGMGVASSEGSPHANRPRPSSVRACHPTRVSGLWDRPTNVQKSGEPDSESIEIASLAFPNRDYLPPLDSQPSPYSIVPLSVPDELSGPELHARLRHSCKRACLPMTMPKASVNEDNGSPARQNDIWCSGQGLHMEPVAKPS